MTPMFKYPQGEGGHEGRNNTELTAVSRYVLTDYLCLTPLLSRFVTRSLRLQTHVYMGGYNYGC